MPDKITVGVPFVKVTFTREELDRYKRRFRKQPLLGGPCVIIGREQGVALDLGWEQEAGWSPWFWPVHGLEPQQWLISKSGGDGGAYRITHAISGLALQTGGSEGAQPTVERRSSSKGQLWDLEPTDDRTAFLLRSVRTGLVLDATQEASKGEHPLMWSEHWAAWQQWVIARLPVTA